MAAIPPPTVNVVRLMGANNPAVFPLLPTQVLDVQLGADIGTGGGGIPSDREAYSNSNYYTPRFVSFLDDEYVALGHAPDGDWGVYKRNQGGADQWGRVCGGNGSGLNGDSRIALHVGHILGVPTLICIVQHGFRLQLYTTLDGTTGANWGTNAGFEISGGIGSVEFGPSVLWRESIAGLWNSNSTLRVYDFRLNQLTEFAIGGMTGNAHRHALHVHEDHVFVGGPFGASYPGLSRVQGLVTNIADPLAGITTGMAVQCRFGMFTDPQTGDLICFFTTVGNSYCIAVSNATSLSPTITDVSDAVFGNVTTTDRPGKYRFGGPAYSNTRNFRIMVDTSTDPANPRVYLYTYPANGNFECWEWKGYGDGVTMGDSEIELVANGAGLSSQIYSIPDNTVGGGEFFPRSAAVEMGDTENPVHTVLGGTKFYFRGHGTAGAGTLTFYGTDEGSMPLTVVPIAGSLTVENGLQNNLEGYWKFNNDALDASGNNRDLTLTGSVPFVAGHIGQAADFPGADSNYYTAAHDIYFNLGVASLGRDTWTVSAWVNIDAFGANAAWVASKITADFLTGWTLQILADGTAQFQQLGQGSFSSAPGAITAGAGWQHILATSDGATTRLYVDGVEVDSGAALVTTGNSEALYVGNRINNDGRWVDGQVDELAIWLRYMNPTEVAGVYNAGSGHELENALTPPTTPSISGNTIINLTPDEGVSLYSVVLDVGAAGVDITEGEYGLIVPNFA